MKISSLIPKYESYLEHEKGSTLKTIKRYKYALVRMLNMMNIISLNQLNENNINQELIYLFWENLESHKKLASSTKSNYIAALKSFLQFAVAKKYLDSNFSDSLSFPRPDQIFKDGFSDDEQILLREYLFNNLGSEKGRRDAALFIFLLATGARIDEVLPLKCNNNKIFDPISGRTFGGFELYGKTFYASILGKGRKERKVSVDPVAIGYLNKHLKNRSINSDIVFNSLKNNVSDRIQLTIMGANKILKSICETVGIYRNISSHAFRHTWTVTMINDNINTKLIMAQGGWDSEKSIEAYYRRDRNLVKRFAGDASIMKKISIPAKQRELEKLMFTEF